jgi:hypothetical protein
VPGSRCLIPASRDGREVSKLVWQPARRAKTRNSSVKTAKALGLTVPQSILLSLGTARRQPRASVTTLSAGVDPSAIART